MNVKGRCRTSRLIVAHRSTGLGSFETEGGAVQYPPLPGEQLHRLSVGPEAYSESLGFVLKKCIAS